MRLTMTIPTVSRSAVKHALEALVRRNQDLLREAGGQVPPLYAARVAYRPEPPGKEDWDALDIVWPRGYGDCEDLAGWRAAELREVGEPARADCYVSRVSPEGRKVWHCIVVRADGTVEDPSIQLGMMRRRGHVDTGTPWAAVSGRRLPDVRTFNALRRWR